SKGTTVRRRPIRSPPSIGPLNSTLSARRAEIGLKLSRKRTAVGDRWGGVGRSYKDRATAPLSPRSSLSLRDFLLPFPKLRLAVSVLVDFPLADSHDAVQARPSRRHRSHDPCISPGRGEAFARWLSDARAHPHQGVAVVAPHESLPLTVQDAGGCHH